MIFPAILGRGGGQLSAEKRFSFLTARRHGRELHRRGRLPHPRGGREDRCPARLLRPGRFSRAAEGASDGKRRCEPVNGPRGEAGTRPHGRKGGDRVPGGPRAVDCPSTMTDDHAAIRRLYAQSATAIGAGDVPALARLYTEDAIQLPPDRPALVGRQAIESSLGEELDGVAVEAAIEVSETRVARDWAFARGTYRVTVTRPTERDPEVAAGNWLDILVRTSDGSWKIARSTWTDRGP